MKRSKPMKRTATLKRNTRMKMRRDTRRRSERVRDTPWMMAVKRLPCCARTLEGASPCRGVVEADHAGKKPAAGRKCDDNLTIPLCSKHHQERGDFSGMFKTWDGMKMRGWLDAQIEFTQFDVRRMLELPEGATVSAP